MTAAKRKKNRRGARRRDLGRELPNPIAVAAVQGALDAVEGELEHVCPTMTARQRSGLRSVFGSLLGVIALEVGKDLTIGEGDFAVKVRPADLQAAGTREMHRFVRLVTDDFVRRKVRELPKYEHKPARDLDDDDVTAGGNPIRFTPGPDD